MDKVIETVDFILIPKTISTIFPKFQNFKIKLKTAPINVIKQV